VEPVRGHFVRSERTSDPARTLIAAMIQQALKDARRGSAEAAEWLDDVGKLWAARFLSVDIGDWRTRPEKVTVGPLTWSERVARYGHPVRNRRRPRPGDPGSESECE
jgi:hypothetical protein